LVGDFESLGRVEEKNPNDIIHPNKRKKFLSYPYFY